VADKAGFRLTDHVELAEPGDMNSLNRKDMSMYPQHNWKDSRAFSGSAKGFTLIEVMLTMGLLAIVLALAIPSYTTYVVRANRSEALQALMTMAACQERLFSRTHVYDANACADNSAGERYTFNSVTSNNDLNFTASAVPKGSQLGDDCGVLSINQAGVKTANNESGSFANTCWKGK